MCGEIDKCSVCNKDKSCDVSYCSASCMEKDLPFPTQKEINKHTLEQVLLMNEFVRKSISSLVTGKIREELLKITNNSSLKLKKVIDSYELEN